MGLMSNYESPHLRSPLELSLYINPIAIRAQEAVLACITNQHRPNHIKTQNQLLGLTRNKLQLLKKWSMTSNMHHAIVDLYSLVDMKDAIRRIVWTADKL